MDSKLIGHVLFPLHEWVKGKPTFRGPDGSRRPVAAAGRAPRAAVGHAEEAPRVRVCTRPLLSAPARRARSAALAYPVARGFPAHSISDAGPARSSFDDLRPVAAAEGHAPHLGRLDGGASGRHGGHGANGLREAVRLRAHRWFGLEPGARDLSLSSPIELTRQDRLRVLRDRLLNSKVLSAFRMSDTLMARYGRAITRFAPEKMVCYAHAAYVLAMYLRGAGGGRRRACGPCSRRRRCSSTSSDARSRRCSERGSPSSMEPGTPACWRASARAVGFYIPAEGILLEVDEAGPDGLGEIVVTNPVSAAMPIIRYRIGDMGELDSSACPCGRTLPCLKRLEGRRIDFLVTRRGW